MWINSRDEEEQKDQEQNNQTNNNETTTENISESQEKTEAKILKVASKYKSQVDAIISTINTASEKTKAWEELTEVEQEILDKKTWYTKYTKEIGKQLEDIIKEGWSEDYIASLEKTKKYIDEKWNELKESFDEKEQKEVEEYKPVWTWASSQHNFDEISKQDQRMNDESKYDREF